MRGYPMKRIQIIFVLLLILSVAINGCGSVPQSVPAATAVPITKTAPAAFTLTATHSLTSTSTPTPSPTQTPAATPAPIRHTPPTLMLHRNNASFDAVQFLK